LGGGQKCKPVVVSVGDVVLNGGQKGRAWGGQKKTKRRGGDEEGPCAQWSTREKQVRGESDKRDGTTGGRIKQRERAITTKCSEDRGTWSVQKKGANKSGTGKNRAGRAGNYNTSGTRTEPVVIDRGHRNPQGKEGKKISKNQHQSAPWGSKAGNRVGNRPHVKKVPYRNGQGAGQRRQKLGQWGR